MIRTLLVPASGSSTDEHVFATAVALARPLNAHLNFFHVNLTPSEAILRTPHADFCVGQALVSTMSALEAAGQELSKNSFKHVTQFCAKHGIPLMEEPEPRSGVTASYSEAVNGVARRLMLRARRNDLTVLGRAHNLDYMPSMLVEDLLLECGRPIVLATESPPANGLKTIVVGWKETAASARAVGAAMPLLECAHKVIFANVSRDADPVGASAELVAQLAWRGIQARVQLIRDEESRAALRLEEAALENQADLLVIGGYSHRPLRETLFGGTTESFIEDARVSVFLMH